jgi:hypothetical protein
MTMSAALVMILHCTVASYSVQTNYNPHTVTALDQSGYRWKVADIRIHALTWTVCIASHTADWTFCENCPRCLAHEVYAVLLCEVFMKQLTLWRSITSGVECMVGFYFRELPKLK